MIYFKNKKILNQAVKEATSHFLKNTGDDIMGQNIVSLTDDDFNQITNELLIYSE